MQFELLYLVYQFFFQFASMGKYAYKIIVIDVNKAIIGLIVKVI